MKKRIFIKCLNCLNNAVEVNEDGDEIYVLPCLVCGEIEIFSEEYVAEIIKKHNIKFI